MNDKATTTQAYLQKICMMRQAGLLNDTQYRAAFAALDERFQRFMERVLSVPTR